MKICWDNLENVFLGKDGELRIRWGRCVQKLMIRECERCGEDFFCATSQKSAKWCYRYCLGKFYTSDDRGKIFIDLFTGEFRLKFKKSKYVVKVSKVKCINCGKVIFREVKNLNNYPKKFCGTTCQSGEFHQGFGKTISKATRKKMSEAQKGKFVGEKSSNWKGGVKEKNIPLYNTYAKRIDWLEEVRRNSDNSDILEVNSDILEVRCSVCNIWFIPSAQNVQDRALFLSEKSSNYEARFYCSDKCKKNCSVFGQMLYPKGHKKPRGGQRRDHNEWANMVFERDNYRCVKCGSEKNVEAHHIEGIYENPIESADVDLGISLCEDCHKEAHFDIGCRPIDLTRANLCKGKGK